MALLVAVAICTTCMVAIYRFREDTAIFAAPAIASVAFGFAVVDAIFASTNVATITTITIATLATIAIASAAARVVAATTNDGRRIVLAAIAPMVISAGAMYFKI